MHLSLSVFTKSEAINTKGCECKFVRNVLVIIRHANLIVLSQVTLYHVMLHGPIWLTYSLRRLSKPHFFRKKSILGIYVFYFL